MRHQQQTRRRRAVTPWLFALLALAGAAGAIEVRHVEVDNGFHVVDGVNIRNGNFAISYTHFNDGTGFEFAKTYNSRSIRNGIFGVGWGSIFESRLTAMPDGSVIVRENGTGNLTTYGEPDDEAIADGVSRIVDVVAAAEPLSSAQRDQLRTDLLASRELRFNKVLQYGIHTDPPTGEIGIDRSTTFVGQSCGLAYVEWDKGMFWRACDAVMESYTPEGGIAMMYDLDRRAYFDIRYQGGMLQRVEMRDRAIDFTTQGGHVTGMKSEGGDTISFGYDAKDNLIHEAWSSGISMDFAYDARANMTEIRYGDGSARKIAYDSDDRATSVTSRDGARTTFEYQKDLADPTRWLTKAIAHAADGEVTAITVYELHQE